MMNVNHQLLHRRSNGGHGVRPHETHDFNDEHTEESP